MKIKSAEFLASAPSLADAPRTRLPEIAFIGRSNVGKSSLINMLTGRRDLAKVSATPGKTVLMNFFRINGSWLLVDLPGYGYAKVAKSQRADFSDAVNAYLEQRENLHRIFVLIDSRLEPQAIDLEFLDWVRHIGLDYSLIFTKVDKQSPTRTRAGIAAFMNSLMLRGCTTPPCFQSSTISNQGRSEILAAIQEAIRTP
ncbi:MAG: YihA family ribosome biogenesis GTP-binding protein [Opitutaceae bacterium]|nr:YihA family ribosome biogenesis GTP-binding protein [Opitutaceae bacterium]